LVGTFCRVRSIVLAAATKLRRIEKRDHGVIHVPPACRRITLGIFLLVLPHLGRAKVPPTSLRAVFLWCRLPLFGLVANGDRIRISAADIAALHALQQLADKHKDDAPKHRV